MIYLDPITVRLLLGFIVLCLILALLAKPEKKR